MYFHQTYITYSSFEEILIFSETYTEWHRVLTEFSEVCIDLTDEQFEEAIQNPNSALMLFTLSTENVIPVCYESFFKEIYGNPTVLKDFPKEIFILDFSEEECKEISEAYGALVISSFALNFPDFYCNFSFKEFAKKEKIECKNKDGKVLEGWNAHLHERSLGPISSILLIDNFLFTNDWHVENIVSLAEAILPKSCEPTFHFTFAFNDKNGLKAKVERLLPEIEKKLKALRRYNIEVGLIINIFKNFHKRIIISNYSAITADRGFCTFKGSVVKEDNDCHIRGGYHLIDSKSDDVGYVTMEKNLKKAKAAKENNDEATGVMIGYNIGFCDNRLF